MPCNWRKLYYRFGCEPKILVLLEMCNRQTISADEPMLHEVSAASDKSRLKAQPQEPPYQQKASSTELMIFGYLIMRDVNPTMPLWLLLPITWVLMLIISVLLSVCESRLRFLGGTFSLGKQ